MCDIFHTAVLGELYSVHVLGQGRHLMVKPAFTGQSKRKAIVHTNGRGGWRAEFGVDLGGLVRDATATCSIDNVGAHRRLFRENYLQFTICGGAIAWKAVPKNHRNVHLAAAIGLNGRKPRFKCQFPSRKK